MADLRMIRPGGIMRRAVLDLALGIAEPCVVVGCLNTQSGKWSLASLDHASARSVSPPWMVDLRMTFPGCIMRRAAVDLALGIAEPFVAGGCLNTQSGKWSLASLDHASAGSVSPPCMADLRMTFPGCIMRRAAVDLALGIAEPFVAGGCFATVSSAQRGGVG